MIHFDSFLQDLSSLELSNTMFGNSGYGNIPEEHVPRVVASINSGLRTLYARLLLKESSLFIEIEEGRTHYPLTSQYAKSNQESPVPENQRFILDSNEAPFKGDLVKVTEVWDSKGKKYSINDAGCCDGVNTPAPNTIQVAPGMGSLRLAVTYQAFHPEVSSDTTYLEMPHSLQDLLRLYVAYRLLSAIGGEEPTIKAQEYLTLFNTMLKDFESADTFGLSVHTSHNKFDSRGFC